MFQNVQSLDFYEWSIFAKYASTAARSFVAAGNHQLRALHPSKASAAPLAQSLPYVASSSEYPMPFRQVSNSYQPDQLNKLSQAFELVWPHIVDKYGAATDVQLESLRTRLANFIVACACHGELDPDRLRQTALRAFNGKLENTGSVARNEKRHDQCPSQGHRDNDQERAHS